MSEAYLLKLFKEKKGDQISTGPLFCLLIYFNNFPDDCSFFQLKK